MLAAAASRCSRTSHTGQARCCGCCSELWFALAPVVSRNSPKWSQPGGAKPTTTSSAHASAAGRPDKAFRGFSSTIYHTQTQRRQRVDASGGIVQPASCALTVDTTARDARPRRPKDLRQRRVRSQHNHHASALVNAQRCRRKFGRVRVLDLRRVALRAVHGTVRSFVLPPLRWGSAPPRPALSDV